MMYKVIAIVGAAGSGKDTLINEIRGIAPHFHKIVGCTSRPKRENEIDGEDYHFITEEEFLSKISANEMLEATRFNDWFYGTPFSSLKSGRINIGAFNPSGLQMVLKNPLVKTKIYYLKVDNKDRMIRQLEREENPDINEICRRYQTDTELFKDIESLPCDILINESQEDLIYCRDRIIADAEKMLIFG